MPHIIWWGNKKRGSEFPEKPLPENAVKTERKGNILTVSIDLDKFGVIRREAE